MRHRITLSIFTPTFTHYMFPIIGDTSLFVLGGGGFEGGLMIVIKSYIYNSTIKIAKDDSTEARGADYYGIR